MSGYDPNDIAALQTLLALQKATIEQLSADLEAANSQLAYERARNEKLRAQVADKQAVRWTSTFNAIVGAVLNAYPATAVEKIAGEAFATATKIHGEYKL